MVTLAAPSSTSRIGATWLPRRTLVVFAVTTAGRSTVTPAPPRCLCWLGIKDPAGGTFLLPLTAVQLLWINFVADGPPALAMALDRNPGVMDRPPRAPTAKLLDAASLRFVAVSASAKAVIGVAIIAALPQLGSSLEETRSALFLYESVLQLMFAYPSRRIESTPLANIWVHLAVWLGVALQALTLVVAPLRTLLGLVPISLAIFTTIILTALLTWGLAEIPCRWAAGETPSKPDRVPRRND